MDQEVSLVLLEFFFNKGEDVDQVLACIVIIVMEVESVVLGFVTCVSIF